jgi:EAL domain-containing protein (putative c-di-GMP-specific phosphodiesterase class I)
LRIIADSVETETQHRALRGIGIPSSQGGFQHRALRAEQFESAMARLGQDASIR